MRVGIGCAAPDPGDEPRARDTAAHAISKALLGAAGLPGAGPESVSGEARGGGHDGAGESADETVAAPALRRLSRTVRAVEGENYQVVNADVTVGAVGADDGDVRGLLADRLHVSPAHVSLKTGPVPAGPETGAVAIVLVDRVSPMDEVHAALRGGG